MPQHCHGLGFDTIHLNLKVINLALALQFHISVGQIIMIVVCIFTAPKIVGKLTLIAANNYFPNFSDNFTASAIASPSRFVMIKIKTKLLLIFGFAAFFLSSIA